MADQESGNTLTVAAIVIVLGLVIGGGLINAIVPKTAPESRRPSAIAEPLYNYPDYNSPTYTTTESDRDRRIDSYVDSRIESSWRPMPGGNSKEDAALVTKDILKARSWEELEKTIQHHSSQGR